MSTKHDIKALMDLEPTEQSPDARREIMNILLSGIRDIELQLGSKERTDAQGVRLAAKDYQSWRRKAIRAMNHMVEKYRAYKTLERADKEKSDYARADITIEQQFLDTSVVSLVGTGDAVPLS
jgi:hypothetical protein